MYLSAAVGDSVAATMPDRSVREFVFTEEVQFVEPADLAAYLQRRKFLPEGATVGPITGISCRDCGTAFAIEKA